MISLRNCYGRTVQTADNKVWLACYLYSIDGVSPPHSRFTYMHLTAFSFSVWKTIPKASENWYIFLSIYIFCPIFNPGGTKEKSLKGKKSYTLIVPRRQRQVENVGKKKREMINVQRLTWCLIHSGRSVLVPLFPYSCIPSWRFPEVLFEDRALFPPLSPITLTLNNTQLDTGAKFV